MKKLVILGAGTAGTMMANKLVKALPPGEWQITVVDKDDLHVYQPGLLFIPFGYYNEHEIVRPRQYLLPPEVTLRLEGIERVEPDENRVRLGNGEAISYDLLIIATGTRIVPEETEGLTGPGWTETAFDFYTFAGARALARKLSDWKGGRLAVNLVDMPIKCPVAPLEFAFLADAFFTERGIRDRVEIEYITPLDGAFTKPRASAMLGDLMNQRGIHVHTDFTLSKVDGEKRVMEAYDGRTIDYDLLVTIPLHAGSEALAGGPLADPMGFVPTDKNTLLTKAYSNVFAIGDATDLPTSKAGSVAHFEGEVLIENVLRYIEGKPLLAGFDGHANCFIETGHNKALLIDFNYTTEPLPGKFPLPVLGPFDLLAESHVNHWGKLGFRWVYWNMLVRGEGLPVDHNMLMAGKRS